MTGPYDDILDAPRPVSKKHTPMPLDNRAAQFLPFDALTGLGVALSEEARLTDLLPELGEDALVALDAQLSRLRQRLSEQPEITLTRFVIDEKKTGGHFEALTGRVRRLDEGNRTLILDDGTAVGLDAVVDLTVREQT